MHIHTRLYQSWMFRTLDIVEHGIEAFDTNEPFENLIVEMLTQVLKLGVYLTQQHKVGRGVICLCKKSSSFKGNSTANSPFLCAPYFYIDIKLTSV